MPGNLPADSPRFRYRNRNLLAGELVEDGEKFVRLWAVNYLSDRQQLLEYKVQFNSKRSGSFQIKNGPTQKIYLKEEALELRNFVTDEDTREANSKLFIRSKRELNLYDTRSSKQVSFSICLFIYFLISGECVSISY